MAIKNTPFFLLFFFSFFLSKANTKSDSTISFILVKQIVYLGNHKTKHDIIKRELDISIGDTIQHYDTTAIFERNINKIKNTGLFNFVSIKHTDELIIILVEERWYVFPIPIFELADRSVNEWWFDRGHDLKRVNLGMDFEHRNFRGRNEQLRIKIQQGFLKKYELSYKLPYLNTYLSNGMKFKISYSTNKNTAYTTLNNKLEFHNSDKITRERFYTSLEIIRRPKFYKTFTTNFAYRYNVVSDTIISLNPNYFAKDQTSQQLFELVLIYKNDKRDLQYYPYKGSLIEGKIEKKGLFIFNNINLLRLNLTTAFFKNHNNKIIWENIGKFQFTTPGDVPYFNVIGLGYGEDLVRGYELDVVDGNHYVLLKESLKFRIFHREKLKTYIPIKQFSATPLSVFIHPHIDAGYVVNPSTYLNNSLADELLLGYGVGIDFVAFYDGVVRLEYSWKKNGQGGFFIHSGIPL